MDLTWKSFLIVCPLVFLGGFVDAIAGGGGLITLPAYFLCGLPAHAALATNKLSSSLGAAVSAARYWRHQYMDRGLILPTVVAALLGSAIGARASLLVSEQALKYLLLIVLPAAAYYVLRKKDFSVQAAASCPPLLRRRTMAITVAAALLIGCYDGFYGPGTGTFLLLIFTGAAKMDLRTASGNAKAINLASNIAALVTFICNGKVHFLLGGTAALFSIAGNYLGAGMLIRDGGKIVRPAILLVLALLFIKILSGN